MSRPKCRDIPATPCLKQQKKATCIKFLSGISRRLGPGCPRNIPPKNFMFRLFFRTWLTGQRQQRMLCGHGDTQSILGNLLPWEFLSYISYSKNFECVSVSVRNVNSQNNYCRVRNYYLIISKKALSCNFFTVNNSDRSQSCNSGRASKCWLSPFVLRGFPGITVNIPQPAQSWKKNTVNNSK